MSKQWYHVYSLNTEKNELYIANYNKAKNHAKKLIMDDFTDVVIGKCENKYEDSPENIIWKNGVKI